MSVQLKDLYVLVSAEGKGHTYTFQNLETKKIIQIPMTQVFGGAKENKGKVYRHYQNSYTVYNGAIPDSTQSTGG
jgi:hypothetical protein